MRYLCGLLACSQHTLVLTGAGASTSAGLLPCSVLVRQFLPFVLLRGFSKLQQHGQCNIWSVPSLCSNRYEDNRRCGYYPHPLTSLFMLEQRLSTIKSNTFCSGVKQRARGATGQGYSGEASHSKLQSQAGATKDAVSPPMHDPTRPTLHWRHF